MRVNISRNILDKLNAKEKKALDDAIRKQCIEVERQFIDDSELLLMYALHKQEGYGSKRLRRTYFGMSKIFREILNKYVFEGPDDVVWFIEREFKDEDIDFRTWQKELEDKLKSGEEIK